MINEVKESLNPTLALIKELNVQIKNDEVNVDTVAKLATTMKFSAMKIEKVLKSNKLSASGGVHIPKEEMKEEDE